jgi:hypothetical protein
MYNLKNLVASPAMGLNFVQFNSGGLHEKQAVVTLSLGTISAFS